MDGSTQTTRRPAVVRIEDFRVTNVELFYDLVYVFAVTQLSHLLVGDPTARTIAYAAVLLAMVWQIWVYMAWATNYLDPNRDSVRVMLLALSFASLCLAVALPQAFGSRGWVVAGLYAGIQIARPLFAIVVLRGDVLQMVFVRVLPWSIGTAALVLLGATQEGTTRAVLWAASVAIDLFGAAIGFHVPGLGHSQTTEWEIDGGHFAERCQAFVLIALGESLVVSGATIAAEKDPSGTTIFAFVAAFVACAGLWWIYFDRAAEDSARLLRESSDPGRLGRDAFHWVHPIIVAGIIVTAAADDLVLADPSAHLSGAPAWLIPGGVALFLGGHALFKAVMWRLVSWPRVIGVAVLLGLGLLAPHVAALTLGGCSLAVIVSVAVADRLMHPVLA